MTIHTIKQLSVLTILFIIAGVAASCKPLIGPVRNELETITAADGTAFNVAFYELVSKHDYETRSENDAFFDTLLTQAA